MVVGCLSLFLAWPSSGNPLPSRSPSDNGLSSVIEAEHANSWLSLFFLKGQEHCPFQVPKSLMNTHWIAGYWGFLGPI